MFLDFKKAVARQFEIMKPYDLFVVDVDKDTLWETYLDSFPEGTNPIFKERTKHDCNCCKSFIRAVGGVVAIIEGEMYSIWDVEIGGHYQVVADAMSALVKSKAIINAFYHTEPVAGVDFNHSQNEDGSVQTWNHFFVKLPSKCVVRDADIGQKRSNARSTYDVLNRGLQEITDEAIETVLELIAQDSIYRGEEFKYTVTEFKRIMDAYEQSVRDAWDEEFVWYTSKNIGQAVARIRNSVIGTLLTDLSAGRDLESAVSAYEQKVAPHNYKRPTALITKSMIDNARKKVAELGFEDALGRRYARIDDITINNVLFASREAQQQMDVFDELADSVPTKVDKLGKVEEVTIDKFVADILPKAESIEMLFENKHAGNLVSLIAPANPDAPTMFKWPNNFSWTYAGELADSIKQRVKNAGGNVDGDLRCSLSWFNFDDLDLHMIEPGGEHIYFSHKKSRRTGGNLDVDMNIDAGGSRNAVENICYPDRNKMVEGRYVLYVNNYTKRESVDVGFEVEVEFEGVIHSFAYTKAVKNHENVTVVEFTYSHKDGIKITKSLPSEQASKELWGIPSQQFRKVSAIMLSPNHWDGHGVGNRHYFFMLEDCRNEGTCRGFFNEFLTDDLREHRKVFEVLGSKMKAPESDEQLSGLGFSSTQRNSIIVKVTGSFARMLKINF